MCTEESMRIHNVAKRTSASNVVSTRCLFCLNVQQLFLDINSNRHFTDVSTSAAHTDLVILELGINISINITEREFKGQLL